MVTSSSASSLSWGSWSDWARPSGMWHFLKAATRRVAKKRSVDAGGRMKSISSRLSRAGDQSQASIAAGRSSR